MIKQLFIFFALLPLWAGVSSLFAGTIDVVSLGAKNDGSADVSAIVNANTAKGDLFFPSGVYKVSHPLVLKNSIRGEGYSRGPRVGSGGTWLVSDIVATNAARGVLEFGDVVVNVENLNIKCFSLHRAWNRDEWQLDHDHHQGEMRRPVQRQGCALHRQCDVGG